MFRLYIMFIYLGVHVGICVYFLICAFVLGFQPEKGNEHTAASILIIVDVVLAASVIIVPWTDFEYEALTFGTKGLCRMTELVWFALARCAGFSLMSLICLICLIWGGCYGRGHDGGSKQ